MRGGLARECIVCIGNVATKKVICDANNNLAQMFKMEQISPSGFRRDLAMNSGRFLELKHRLNNNVETYTFSRTL